MLSRKTSKSSRVSPGTRVPFESVTVTSMFVTETSTLSEMGGRGREGAGCDGVAGFVTAGCGAGDDWLGGFFGAGGALCASRAEVTKAGSRRAFFKRIPPVGASAARLRLFHRPGPETARAPRSSRAFSKSEHIRSTAAPWTLVWAATPEKKPVALRFRIQQNSGSGRDPPAG